MGTLRRYVIQRLVASALTLLGVSCIIFLMVRLLPGDPARVIAGVHYAGWALISLVALALAGAF